RLIEQLLNRHPESTLYEARLYEAHLASGRIESNRGDRVAAQRDLSIALAIAHTADEAKAAQMALAALASAPTPGDAVSTPRPAGQFSRDQFNALVYHKSPDQIIAAVGRPDATETLNGETHWSYKGRTYDPASGRVDAVAQIILVAPSPQERAVIVNFSH